MYSLRLTVKADLLEHYKYNKNIPFPQSVKKKNIYITKTRHRYIKFKPKNS